ncbi:hypothetical protein Smp_000770 [Schistosoma mansoni]|uniref:Ovule protein n=1 Tax=Schistosoma mansoni TaxID=6183 RepID=G4V668_SCHMA|nr:hypothetical protein Smp_000770 [Schistosoma mansoni]|eukprot:XP_018649559.1 hypothetical protein Smp_000770 [Schistosoma mansoni]
MLEHINISGVYLVDMINCLTFQYRWRNYNISSSYFFLGRFLVPSSTFIQTSLTTVVLVSFLPSYAMSSHMD